MIVDVHLIDAIVGAIRGREPIQDRQLNAAWAAPGRPKIDQHRFVVFDGCFERSSVEFSNHELSLPGWASWRVPDFAPARAFSSRRMPSRHSRLAITNA